MTSFSLLESHRKTWEPRLYHREQALVIKSALVIVKMHSLPLFSLRKHWRISLSLFCLLPGRPFPVLTGTGDPSFPVVSLHTLFITGHSDTSGAAGHNYSFLIHTDILEASLEILYIFLIKEGNRMFLFKLITTCSETDTTWKKYAYFQYW